MALFINPEIIYAQLIQIKSPFNTRLPTLPTRSWRFEKARFYDAYSLFDLFPYCTQKKKKRMYRCVKLFFFLCKCSQMPMKMQMIIKTTNIFKFNLEYKLHT